LLIVTSLIWLACLWRRLHPLSHTMDG
jgi:hypothetical protein